MAVVLRRGLESNPDWGDRLAFIAEHRGLWIGGWLYWTGAALAFLNFMTALVRAPHRDALRFHLKLAMIFMFAGLAADFSAQAAEMGTLPRLAGPALADWTAAKGGHAFTLFRQLHRAAVLLTGFLANGLYTLAVAMALNATRKSYPAWVAAAGLGVLAAGFSASAAALAGSVPALVAANAVLTLCLLAWLAGVGLEAGRRELEAGRLMSARPSFGRERRQP